MSLDNIIVEKVRNNAKARLNLRITIRHGIRTKKKKKKRKTKDSFKYKISNKNIRLFCSTIGKQNKTILTIII